MKTRWTFQFVFILSLLGFLSYQLHNRPAGMKPVGNLSVNGVSVGIDKSLVLQKWGEPSDASQGKYFYWPGKRALIDASNKTRVVIGGKLEKDGFVILSEGNGLDRVYEMLGEPNEIVGPLSSKMFIYSTTEKHRLSICIPGNTTVLEFTISDMKEGPTPETSVSPH